MRKLVMVVVLIMVVGPCGAMEIPFRDGSVVEAVTYTVNGSYLMLEMPNGGKVAYDVADIDLDSLQLAQAALDGDQQPEPAETAAATLGNSGSLFGAGEDPTASTGGLTITDQNVRHVRGSGIAGPEDEPEEAPADAVPDGFEQGGNVLLNSVSVSPLEGGDWEVKGEVVNRTAEPVLDVRVILEAAVPDGDPWTASVGVSGILGPDEKASFTHTFPTPASAGEGWSPQVQASVMWMKSETRLEPNYDRLAPSPGALPVDRGGVGGVDVREEVEL